MAIRTVVTDGFGNGTFNGTIPLVVTEGYTQAIAAIIIPPLTAVLKNDGSFDAALKNDGGFQTALKNDGNFTVTI